MGRRDQRRTREYEDDTGVREHDTFARTIVEVRDEWNRRSGENISRARVWQILVRAEEKLRRALRQEGPC